METILGYIHSVVFYNEGNSYVIAKIKLDQKKDEKLVITGYFELPKKNDLCRYFGEFIDHPKYGRQFKVENYEKILPNDEEAIIRFLSSSSFPKVGTAAAKKVFDELGADCLEKIKNDDSALDSVSIKKEQKDSIIKGIKFNHRLEEAIKIFVGHGIDLKTLMKMDAIYGDRMVGKVLENPYILISDIDGINFKIADRIAFSIGISQKDERRLKALICHAALQICYKTQDTYTNLNEIYKYILSNIPDIDYEEFNNSINEIALNGDIIIENERIYPTQLYYAEEGIAQNISKFIKRTNSIVSSELINEEIAKIERQMGIEYSNEQKESIITCINNGLTIITGGPGTGKTTVVNAIIKIYENLFSDSIIQICAPTGRAAKRISELSEHEATTIHRYLGWDLETNTFKYHENNQLFGDFLIIDEFSMVDCQLFDNLLKATQNFSKILLIGDDQQLPPVSPGDVLRDLLSLDFINKVKLIKIHRQSENSGIIPLSYDVRMGVLDISNLHKDDVSFIECSSIQVRNYILNIVQKAVDKGMTVQDIQVLAPMYDGVAGINNLNDILREYFNPQTNYKKTISIGRTTYRVGDKILQLKNQPDDDVYNGDIGILEDIISDEDKQHAQIVVNFDGNLVKYSSSNFSNLSHAYCISVHKSQGSEYRLVIMPILKEYSIMLKRKLIYTGISRAKEALVLLGSIDAFEYGIQKMEHNKRKTSLKERIKELIR